MENIAIITARSGSKGVVDKNIKKLNGMPLMAYSIRAAIESKMFSEIMVSTDSAMYAEIGRSYGASVPFLRSSEMSSDTAESWDVVCEVLKEYCLIGRRFDSVCLLQPTSPARTAEDIRDGYAVLFEKKADAVTSVCEVEYSPLWTMMLPESHSLSEYRQYASNAPRQQLDKYYRVNGALYIRRILYEGEKIKLKIKNEYASIMEISHSIDIDSQFDFELAEFYVRRNKQIQQ